MPEEPEIEEEEEAFETENFSELIKYILPGYYRPAHGYLS